MSLETYTTPYDELLEQAEQESRQSEKEAKQANGWLKQRLNAK